MPPKARFRPAAAVGRGLPPRGARGAPKAKAKAKAHPPARKRPALEGERGDQTISEALKEGLEVEACKVELKDWVDGLRIALTEATYWEEKALTAGVIKGLTVEGGQAYLRLKLEGTQCEGLLKWAGRCPGKLATVHLCGADCGKLAQDGLIHVAKVRRVIDGLKDPWMDNLMEVGKEDDPPEDEMRKIRERAAARGAEREGRREKSPLAKGDGSSSPSGKKKKSKKKQKKKRERAESEEKAKVAGSKDLTAVFGGTAMDPSPAVRKRIKRKARRLAKKKAKNTSSSSSSSGGSSSGSGPAPGEEGHLFGEELKVKSLWKKFPGSLTVNTLEMIQTTVVTQSGQPWNLDFSALPPLFSQYWRMVLGPKMSGPMGRETQTLCYLQDLILQGRIAAAADVVTQRLKSLEQVCAGGQYQITQRQELVPMEVTYMTSPAEALAVSRLHKEEQRARASTARPWERRTEWERRGEENKGKGKTKDGKSKGKGKNDKGRFQKDEKDKEHK